MVVLSHFFIFKKIIISGPAGPPYFSPKLPKSSGAIWRGEPWGRAGLRIYFYFFKNKKMLMTHPNPRFVGIP